MALDAFMPQGLTQLIAATTTPSTAISLSPKTPSVRIYADAAVHFAFGSSTGSSGILATMATTSTPANGIGMMGPSVEVFTIGGENTYLSFISSATANVRVTPGYGV